MIGSVSQVAPLAQVSDVSQDACHRAGTGTAPDWQSVPVADIPVSRFVIPLHDLDWRVIRLGLDLPTQPAPVHAFSRWPDAGPVDVSDGRHRVLVAALRGQTSVPTRLLVIP